MNFCYWVCVHFTDKKLGKGKDKIDDEDVTFQRMVAKVSALIHLLFFFSFLCLCTNFGYLFVTVVEEIFIVILLLLF